MSRGEGHRRDDGGCHGGGSGQEPVWAPPVCTAGETATSWAGAMGVVWGLPDASGPSSDFTSSPSLTIASTDPGSDGEILAWKCTSTLPPAGTVRPLHCTFPPPPVEKAPPESADTKLV